MNPIERLLREKIGLDAASIGSSAIQRTVRLRMKRLGFNRTEDYQRLLESRQGRDEWEELVESVVVIETWFFRDRDSFAALVQLCLGLVRQRGVRLLSVACASGEEPYSLVMALLDAGIPPARFTIDAVDLSARALARAKRAVYGKNSFRGKYLDFRERYFEATQEGQALHPRVRDCIHFHRANICEGDFLAGSAAYDFIFCRNLLIYFDGATQAKALNKLGRMLVPRSGLLFVGPAELPLATAHGFVSASVPMAFACRRACDASSSLPPRRESQVGVPTPVASQPSAASKPFPPGDRPQSAAPTHAAPPARRDLVAARQLADAGKLAEAAAICQAHLNNHGPSAQAYYLLGLVRDADGDAQAMDCYRKALYLEPNHYETLLQMSLLLERNGDATGARTFKRRADRVEAQARRATKLDHASIETPAAAADVYAAERVLQKP